MSRTLLFIALIFSMLVAIAAGELIRGITGTDWTFFLGLAIGLPVLLVLYDLILRRGPRA